MSDENNNQVRESLSSIATPKTDPDEYLSTFPPGYRFAPTDVEIILHYLTTKVENRPIPINKINEVNLYDHPPEYLTSKIFKSYENVWYYYTSRDRKYRNGVRPNRSAGDGYWKATGVDKKIKGDDGTDVGSKKTLVFYRGKAPKGDKTDWIMHEFRVEQSQFERNSRPDMLLDNYVLCRIYNKGTTKSKTSKIQSEAEAEAEAATTTQAHEENTTSTTDPMEYSNEEKEEEDQRVLNMITDEPATTEVGLMSSTTSSMMEMFGGITFDDPLPITPYIPPQTYHHGPLRVQINNNYINTSISTSTDDFSTYDSHMEWGTFYDGSEFIHLDYSDMKSSLLVNQQVPPPPPMQGGNYNGSPLSVQKVPPPPMQGGNYGGSPLSVQKVPPPPMQGGNYGGSPLSVKNDNIFAAGWIGSVTTASMIPNYCQDYPHCPALPRN